MLKRNKQQKLCRLSQENEFFQAEPNGRQDAQRLWQMERQQLRDTIRRQKAQMAADKMWLEKEERLLVGNTASLVFVNTLAVSARPPRRVPVGGVPLARRGRSARLKIDVPLLSVPKRGSVSVCYQINLPVLLQDPVGPDETPPPAVGFVFT